MFIACALFSGIVIFINKGFDQRAIQLWLILNALFAIPCYFASRRNEVPSEAERFLARAWQLFRRILCFLTAAIFIGGAIFVWKDPKGGWLPALFMGSMALAFIWWGIFGAGESRSFTDDRPLHEARKKRYGWK